MACRAVESWTFTSLVGAYLDLTLAYLFLVGATIAFFVSNLFSLFGLSLPCTCDGRFGHSSCAQNSLLFDFSKASLAAVHRSLCSRFPFDSFITAGSSPSHRCRYDVQCPSEHCDLPQPPSGRPEEHVVRPNVGCSISDLEKSCSTSAEGISGVPWDSDEKGLGEEDAYGEEKGSCKSVEGLIRCDEGASLEMMGNLERELKKERGAREALYLELEKERSAAASAADEAMAMILRLQREKAEINMESRQYQRMVEEKYAYDEEEMEVLKEIIVRREREKHVLEKEVEMYKQMMNSGERVEQEFDTQRSFLEDKLDTLVNSDDAMLMLQQIYNSVGKKEELNDFGVESSPIMNSSIPFLNQDYPNQKFVGVRKHTELFNSTDGDEEFLEKTILTTHNNSSSSNIINTRSVDDSAPYELNVPFEIEYHKDITDLTVEDEGERDTPFETIVSFKDLCRVGNDDTNQRCLETSPVETESSILDVHVIDDGQLLQFEENINQNIIASEEDSSYTNLDEMELSIRRSCSDITNRISMIDSLSRRASFFNLRSSLPSVESERYKIENEVDVLRKRLEIIRQGREKLSLQAEQKEKETFQLKLLDEIAFQLKEIKKVTKPAKRLHRVSLPLLPSKGHGNGEI